MSKKKGCELCCNPARMFCESDQASLCWDCDGKVHAANFLVAKHSRTLLCHLCHSPTPWKAAGPKLRPTVSVCQACADEGENRGASSSISRREDDEEYDSESDSDSQESESDDGEYDSYDEGEDDGENQVVPWSISSCKPPSPSETTAASSEEDISFSSSKRLIRDSANFESEDEEEDGCCSNRRSESDLFRFNLGESESNYCSSSSALRPIKMQRTSNSDVIPGGGQTQANSVERRRN